MYNKSGINILISLLNNGVKAKRSFIKSPKFKHSVQFLSFLEKHGYISGYYVKRFSIYIFLRYRLDIRVSSFSKIVVSKRSYNYAFNDLSTYKNLNPKTVYWSNGIFFGEGSNLVKKCGGIFVCCIFS